MPRTPIIVFLLSLMIALPAWAGDRYSDLIAAAGKGDTATVQALLDNSADVNAKDKGGNTALKLAASNGHTEIVELLKQAGAKE